MAFQCEKDHENYVTVFPRDDIKDLFINEVAIKRVSDYYLEDTSVSLKTKQFVFQSVLNQMDLNVWIPPDLHKVNENIEIKLAALFALQKETQFRSIPFFAQVEKINEIVAGEAGEAGEAISINSEYNLTHEALKVYKKIREGLYTTNVSIDKKSFIEFLIHNIIDRCVQFNNTMIACVKDNLNKEKFNEVTVPQSVTIDLPGNSIEPVVSLSDNVQKKRTLLSIEDPKKTAPGH